MNADEYLYNDINNILENGYRDIDPRPHYKDGEPAHSFSVNHNMRKYDLSNGDFPICTLRPIAWKTAIKEILWIYQDQSNSLETLRSKYNVRYWDDWESYDVKGTIGYRYGHTVKKYDQMMGLLRGLHGQPYGRRHIVDLYQFSELQETDGLYPCAFLTIWNVRNNATTGKEYLDMMMVQRSGDMLTASGAGGINEVQYAALQMMVARHIGLEPGVFSHVVANEQIYDRHIPAALELKRRYEADAANVSSQEPKGSRLRLNEDVNHFFKFTIDDFKMENYHPKKPQLELELGI